MPRQRPDWYREDGYVTTDDPIIKVVNNAFIQWVREMTKRGKIDLHKTGVLKATSKDLDDLFLSVVASLGKL